MIQHKYYLPPLLFAVFDITMEYNSVKNLLCSVLRFFLNKQKTSLNSNPTLAVNTFVLQDVLQWQQKYVYPYIFVDKPARNVTHFFCTLLTVVSG